jgi:hypothetical protein
LPKHDRDLVRHPALSIRAAASPDIPDMPR